MQILAVLMILILSHLVNQNQILTKVNLVDFKRAPGISIVGDANVPI